MTSVGDTLRRERLERKLDLDYISKELKISRRLLDAIESDQYDRLPGGVFAKSFVRQYANLMGLDAEDLASRVQRAIEPPVPPSGEQKRPAAIAKPVAMPRLEEWKTVGDRRFRFSGSLPAAALVVVVMLICSGVYAWIQRPRTSPVTARTSLPPAIRVEPAPDPGVNPGMPNPPPPLPASNEPATPAVQPSAAPLQTTPPSQPAKPAEAVHTAAAGPVHVEIVAEDVVWVLARVDGKFAFTGTMEANSRRTLDGEKDVTLRLGNAGAVTVLLNGKDMGPVGPKGQPRTLQFTSGGFQIVSAKPAADVPFDPLDRI